MHCTEYLKRWLVSPPLSGWLGVVGTIAAIVLPTLLLLLIDGGAMRIGCSPFIFFVLVTVLLIGWKHAAFVAFVSALICDSMMNGTLYPMLAGGADVVGILAFLATSALIIGFVQAINRLLETLAHPGKAGNADGVIFSSERGHAWASWCGANGFICLGPQERVAEMMEDFLAQVELGKRLQGMQPQS